MRTTAPVPASSRYLSELREALTSLDVPPAQREQVVAEVDAHVRDTGEDPAEACGCRASGQRLTPRGRRRSTV